MHKTTAILLSITIFFIVFMIWQLGRWYEYSVSKPLLSPVSNLQNEWRVEAYNRYLLEQCLKGELEVEKK